MLADEDNRQFDLWCDSIYVLDPDQTHVEVMWDILEDDNSEHFTNAVELTVPTHPLPELNGCGEDSNGVAGVQGDTTHEIQNKDDYESDIANVMSILSITENPEVVEKQYSVCKGLAIDTIANLGFSNPDNFLRYKTSCPIDSSRTTNPRPMINNPCMTNVGQTVYSKQEVSQTVDTRGETLYPALIKALWMLMMKNPDTTEPRTPEALAVMVHLIVKKTPS